MWHADLKEFLMFSTSAIVTNIECVVTLLTPVFVNLAGHLAWEPLREI